MKLNNRFSIISRFIQPPINLSSCVQNGFVKPNFFWAIDKDLIIRSFVQTGVTNTGLLEVGNLHTNLKDLLEGNVEVEVIQQELEEEGSTGLTDNEDSDDDDDVEDSQVF